MLPIRDVWQVSKYTSKLMGQKTFVVSNVKSDDTKQKFGYQIFEYFFPSKDITDNFFFATCVQGRGAFDCLTNYITFVRIYPKI